MKCKICGKYSGHYDLCRDCYKEQKEDEYDDEYDDENESNYCLLCGEEIDEDKTVCSSCWKEAKKRYKEFDDESYSDVTDHYFNQKNATLRIRSNNYAEKSKEIMVALAVQLYYDFNNNYLLDRLEKDFNDIDEKRSSKKSTVESKEENISTEIKNEIDDYRKTYPATIACEDGHYVRSKAEKIIDDWLYNHNYIHAYEKSVYSPDEDKEYIPDFYLKNEDIFIEYWGLTDNESYLLKKETKSAFYTRNNIRFISLEDKEIEHLGDVLPRLIARAKNLS